MCAQRDVADVLTEYEDELLRDKNIVGYGLNARIVEGNEQYFIEVYVSGNLSKTFHGIPVECVSTGGGISSLELSPDMTAKVS